MKLLQINVTANSGSTGRIAENIGGLFIDRGNNSFIAYGRNANQSSSKLINIGSEFEIYYHVLKTRVFDRHGFSSKRATEDLIRKIEIIKPDIIGLHNLHGYYLHIGILFDYLKSLTTPVIWTLHDCWPFTGHCIYFDYVGCDKWKTQCNNCPQIHSYPKSVLIDNSYKNFNKKKEIFNGHNNLTIVTPSQWLKDLVEQSFLKYSISVINNGIDIEQFKILPERSDKFGGKKILLGVASVWEERKGLEDFIELSKLMDQSYQVVLIGLTDKQKKTIPDNIIGISRTESISELVEWYNKADVFLNPTYEDNFPTTNLESLACGTPVVTYNTGGSVESINEETGVIVSKGDIVGLKEAINSIVNTKNKFTYKKCRKRAVENFNKDDRFMDYYDLYMSKLKTSGS
jgi:putative colanic acid biosynthesis glycosyltransferase